ncbi:hypothetical protein T4B_6714 [Trichinella pseudospiralis]|uniref:Uncharacterized protein n=1 Tax=Trichinella pseudospiralis TaxID=6337 RepID=A0A0V1JBV6_TRIPS|nr:hypothetical protein T4A_7354 [Trichinella pseudospiralis]KRZ32471.1 hypothetical protein T4B_6714 [Trichinella pseudospiralis]
MLRLCQRSAMCKRSAMSQFVMHFEQYTMTMSCEIKISKQIRLVYKMTILVTIEHFNQTNTMQANEKQRHVRMEIIFHPTIFQKKGKFIRKICENDKKRLLNFSTPNRCTEFLAASCIRLRTFAGICKIFTIASEYSSADDAVKPTL